MSPSAAAPALRTVRATRYVTAFREGGSLPGLVEADDDALYGLCDDPAVELEHLFERLVR